MDNKSKLATMPVNRLVWNVSFPLMISMLIQSMYNIVDGIFVAKLSENALTATSLAYPIQILSIAISVGTGVGLNALLSKSLGQRDHEKVKRVAGNGLFAAFLGYIPFLLFGCFAVRPFLSLYTSDPAILEDSVAYLRICMVFSLGIFVAASGERCLQATGKTWLSMLAQTVGAITNIILDPIMIFGLLGFPAMGVAGAAIATVIGQWAAAILSLILNFACNKEVPIKIRRFKPDFGILRQIYRIGLPTMVMQASGSIMTLSMNAILYLFSSTAVAFFGVYYKLQNFLYMLINGLAQGLIPIVAYNDGAKQADRVRQSYRVAVTGAIVIMLVGTVLFWLIPGPLLSIFDASPDMLAIGIPAMRIISVVFVMTGITVTTGFFFVGLGNGVVNMVSTLLRQLVLLLPLAYLFASMLGLNYTWYAFWISESVACAFAVIYYRRHWKKAVA